MSFVLLSKMHKYYEKSNICLIKWFKNPSVLIGKAVSRDYIMPIYSMGVCTELFIGVFIIWIAHWSIRLYTPRHQNWSWRYNLSVINDCDIMVISHGVTVFLDINIAVEHDMMEGLYNTNVH